jgi:putative endonuclease
VADDPTACWQVYVVRCTDGTFYTGITTDVSRRIDEHNAGAPVGARYTRARRPVVLVYQEAADSRSAAASREYHIKQLSRADKERLILTAGNGATK